MGTESHPLPQMEVRLDINAQGWRSMGCLDRTRPHCSERSKQLYVLVNVNISIYDGD